MKQFSTRAAIAPRQRAARKESSAFREPVQPATLSCVRRSECGRFALVRDCCRRENVPGLIRIGSDEYTFSAVPVCSPEVVVCFRLAKQNDDKSDPDGHTVTILDHSADCTCGDFIFRKAAGGGLCKHLRAVQGLDMVPAVHNTPSPIPEGTEDPFAGVSLI
ncbi:SWIM zinc finger family protein [Zavarzinella formosa]|uniref:SWIM zinc finger family protein n=1 Tax=Zavarzinella formosa TaxID=360055 RepID=UPI0003632591|nr:SWIM zinc finger family protein [Zavarzinella formosa]